jgi:hypothetical protein
MRNPRTSRIEELFHPCVRRRRSFRVPEAWPEKRILLNFGVVDYQGTVWTLSEISRHLRGDGETCEPCCHDPIIKHARTMKSGSLPRSRLYVEHSNPA